MASTLKKLEDNSIQLTITIPKEEVAKTRDAVLSEITENATLPGFRKGKAPQKLVEKNSDPEKIREEILKKLLPKTYIDAVQEHKLHPIINPKIHVDKLDDDADWEYTATTAETPEIKLGDYKKNIQAVTAKSKIVLPGKEQQEASFDEIVKALLQSVDMKIPSVLIESEVDRLLSQMLDEIRRLGLTLDQYLSSTGKNPETLRQEYQTKAETDMKFEFALQKIAEEEKISVEPKEIDEAIQKAQSDSERQSLQANSYLLANILRQQKTLDFLKNL